MIARMQSNAASASARGPVLDKSGLEEGKRPRHGETNTVIPASRHGSGQRAESRFRCGSTLARPDRQESLAIPGGSHRQEQERLEGPGLGRRTGRTVRVASASGFTRQKPTRRGRAARSAAATATALVQRHSSTRPSVPITTLLESHAAPRSPCNLDCSRQPRRSGRPHAQHLRAPLPSLPRWTAAVMRQRTPAPWVDHSVQP